MDGIFVADGAKNGLQGEDSIEVEPLAAGCGSWSCCLSGRINEEPEWCFVRWLQFCQNLEELTHGVRPGHADILILEHEEIAIPRPGLCLPRSAQVQLDWCLREGQMVPLVSMMTIFPERVLTIKSG